MTDNEAATLPTAPGVIQGYNGHALVAATRQVIRHAATFGNGPDAGHGAPMLEGAQGRGKAMGLPEAHCEGKLLSADSTSHSEAKLQI